MVIKHLYISGPFSDSVKKMLTALFNLVWNKQKNTGSFFFDYQGKMFLNPFVPNASRLYTVETSENRKVILK